jgi:hypothetical protein
VVTFDEHGQQSWFFKEKSIAPLLLAEVEYFCIAKKLSTTTSTKAMTPVAIVLEYSSCFSD